MKVDETFLKHYGILGMKWGKRKADISGKIKARVAGSPDNERKVALKRKRVKDMSNAELSELTKRIQLETSYRTLTAKKKSAARKAVDSMMLDLGKKALSELVKTQGPVIMRRVMAARSRMR